MTLTGCDVKVPPQTTAFRLWMHFEHKQFAGDCKLLCSKFLLEEFACIQKTSTIQTTHFSVWWCIVFLILTPEQLDGIIVGFLNVIFLEMVSNVHILLLHLKDLILFQVGLGIVLHIVALALMLFVNSAMRVFHLLRILIDINAIRWLGLAMTKNIG